MPFSENDTAVTDAPAKPVPVSSFGSNDSLAEDVKQSYSQYDFDMAAYGHLSTPDTQAVAERASKVFDMSVELGLPIKTVEKYYDQMTAANPADVLPVDPNRPPGLWAAPERKSIMSSLFGYVGGPKPERYWEMNPIKRAAFDTYMASRNILTRVGGEIGQQMGAINTKEKQALVEDEMVNNPQWYQKSPELLGWTAEQAAEYYAMKGVWKASGLHKLLLGTGEKLAAPFAAAKVAQIAGETGAPLTGMFSRQVVENAGRDMLTSFLKYAPENVSFLTAWNAGHAAITNEPVGEAAWNGTLWGAGLSVLPPFAGAAGKIFMATEIGQRTQFAANQAYTYLWQNYPRLMNAGRKPFSNEFMDEAKRQFRERFGVDPTPAEEAQLKEVTRIIGDKITDAAKGNPATDAYWNAGREAAAAKAPAEEARPVSETAQKPAGEAVTTAEAKTVQPKAGTAIEQAANGADNAAAGTVKPAKALSPKEQDELNALTDRANQGEELPPDEQARLTQLQEISNGKGQVQIQEEKAAQVGGSEQGAAKTAPVSKTAKAITKITAPVEDEAADQTAIEQGKPEERIKQIAEAADKAPENPQNWERIDNLQKAAEVQQQDMAAKQTDAVENSAAIYGMLKAGQSVTFNGKKYSIPETKYGYTIKTVENGIATTEGGDPRGGGYSFDEAWNKLSNKLGIGIQEPPTFKEQPQSPADSIATQIANKLAIGEAVSPDDFFAMADKAYGGSRAEGKYGVSDAYDALELGVNKFLKGRTDPTVDVKQAVEQVKAIETMLDQLPTQRNRSGEKDLYQQFSTPPDYSYAVNWIANIKPTDIVLEPEAGTGSLIVHAMNASPAKTIANELSNRRAELLKSLGVSEVTTEDAEQIHNILETKPTVVIMNPPFSRAAERMKDIKVYGTDLKHIDASLKLLADNGRLVAIMGRPLHEEKGESQAFTKWLNEVKKKHTVSLNIYVGRDVYKKYGTSFPTRVLVIDKTGPQGSVATVGGYVDTIEQLVYDTEGVRNERRAVQQAAAESDKQAKTVEAGGQAGEQLPVQSSTGDMGITEHIAAQRAVGEVPSGVAAAGGSDVGLEAGQHSEAIPAGRGIEPGGNAPELRPESDRGLLGETQPAQAATGAPAGSVESTSATSITREKKQFTESIFEGYKPTISVPGSKSHPGSLVESASMASVDAPKVQYKLSLPKRVISDGLLSDVQLETVALAGQSHSQMLPATADGIVARKAIMIGDGTGVGKGRESAGIILDNWQQGRRKAMWISKGQKLFQDATRDWMALGGKKEDLFNLTNVKTGNDIAAKQGIMYSTYDTMRSKAKAKEGEKGKSRLDQIIDWVGKDFDGVLIFDEAHNMANATASAGGRGFKKPSQRALMGIELQRQLPNARVVYVSATAATEVSNFAYAERLGMWGPQTPFANKIDFITEIASGGVAAMELVAKDMKAMGLYVSRSLSYNDGTEAGTVKYKRVEHNLTPEQTAVYDELATAWQTVLQNIDAALKMCGAGGSGKAKMFATSQFWSTHQRFFNQIITAMQTPSVVNAIEKDLAEGKSAVIQLTNTNEAAQERALADRDEDDDLDDFDVTPRDILMQFIENSFPVTQYEEYVDENGNINTRPVHDSKGNAVVNKDAVELRDRLLDKLGGVRVPDSPLDMIINHFGADKVAEVTGRKRRVILKKQPTGAMHKEIDKRSKNSNATEISKFMAGKKHVLIFSECGGTGASYHADRTAGNQEMREHYLLQPGWKADAAMQGLGRTHRTNQRQAPEYALVTTNLKGQKRFISSIARRLDQLGALTKGERRAGSTGIFSAADNLESTEASDALKSFLRDMTRNDVEGIDLATFQKQTGLKLVDDRGNPIQKEIPIQQFLNRLLSLTVDMQDKVFDAFDQRLQQKIEQATLEGTLDQGMETYRADKIVKADEQTVYTHPETGATTKYVQLKAYRKTSPIKWDAIQKQNPLFYVQSQHGKIYAVLPAHTKTDANTGQVINQYKLVDQSQWHYIDQGHIDYDYQGRWKQIESANAKALWQEALKGVPDYTEHTEHVISGLMVPIWDRLEGKPKIYRFKTNTGESVVGRIIPEESIDNVLERLGAGREKLTMALAEMKSSLESGSIEVDLANKWKLKSSIVSGEKRIEIVGPDFQDVGALEGMGVFSERVQYKTRYFIPTGEAGSAVLNAVVESHPVAGIRNRSSRGMRPGFALNPLEEFRTKAHELAQRIDELLKERTLAAEKSAESEKRVEAIKPTLIEHHKAYRQAQIEALALEKLIGDVVPNPDDQMNMVHAYEQKHDPRYWDKLNDLQKSLVEYMEKVGAKVDNAAIENSLVTPREFKEGVRYLFHWQRNKEGEPYAGNYGKFSKNLPQSKQRKYETYEESMAAGVAPVTTNLGKILGEQLKAVMGAKNTRDMYRTMMADKISVRPWKAVVKTEDTENYVRYHDPLLDKPIGFKTEDGTTIILKSDAGIHKDLFPFWKAYRENPDYGTLSKMNFAMRSWKFAVSMFHPFSLAMQDIMLSKYPLDVTKPFRDIYQGSQLRKNITNDEISQLLYRNGLGEGGRETKDYFIPIPGIKQVTQFFTTMIFDHIQPDIKWAIAYNHFLEFEPQLEKLSITRDELARQSVKLADSMMSGEDVKLAGLEACAFMNKFYFSPMARKIWVNAMLSPTWQREHLLAGKRILQSVVGEKVSEKLGMDEDIAGNKTAYMRYLRNALIAYGAANLYNYLVTKHKDGQGRFMWENPNPFLVRAWWNEPDGKIAYIRPFKSIYEIPETVSGIIHGNFDKLTSKLSAPIAAMVNQLWPEYSKYSDKGIQGWIQRGIQIAKDLGVPMSAGNTGKVVMGEKSPWDIAAPFAGMPVSGYGAAQMQKDLIAAFESHDDKEIQKILQLASANRQRINVGSAKEAARNRNKKKDQETTLQYLGLESKKKNGRGRR